MGIFQEMKKVRNLAPIPLTVQFDGQQFTLVPGINEIPWVTVEFAMNQNPVMGTADADNPNISGGRYLVVPVGSKYDREPLTREEWEEHCSRPCRINEVAFFEDRLGPGERMIARGKGKATHAKSAFDTGVKDARPASISLTDRD